jgi:hypothetical protein
MQTSETARLRRVIEALHLGYLGLLPALATFGALLAYGHPSPFLLFIGGIVVVSVYLAVVASYTQHPSALGALLFVLLDGPFWVLASWAAGGTLFTATVDAFLVDGVAIWLAIVWLALTTDRPAPEQRAATLGFALAALATVVWHFWPHVRETVLGHGLRPVWLSLGMLEALVARHFLLGRDRVMRGVDASIRYIILFLSVWIAAMFAGNVIYELTG